MIPRALVPTLALVFCAPAAVAQDTADPAPAESPAGVAAPVDFPWETIAAEWTERRYKVEAIRFKARDETGIDWWGDDEVMVKTTDAKGFTTSDEIGGIDSGDTHEFDDPAVSCIVGVLPGEVTLDEDSVCGEAGEPGPFSLRIELWEKDRPLFGFGTCVPGEVPPGRHVGRNCVDGGDDFIGWIDLFFPLPDLESTLLNVGDTFTETVVLSPCRPGEDTCDVTYGPDYSFTYRTTRLGDVATDFGSELVTAMERSGITVAGNAVAAGLRSLAAPVDRNAEPEVGPTLAGN